MGWLLAGVPLAYDPLRLLSAIDDGFEQTLRQEASSRRRGWQGVEALRICHAWTVVVQPCPYLEEPVISKPVGWCQAKPTRKQARLDDL